MRLKKSVFGYINFSIGTLIMSVFLYTLFVSLFRSFEEKAGKRLLVLGIKLSHLGGFGLALVSVLLIFLLFFIKSKITVKKFKGSGLVFGLVYWFSFAFFLSYGFYVRISNLGVLKKWDTIQHYTESVSKPGYWQNLLDLFYGRETSFENFFHKAYSYIAALFLSIFGDTLTVPVFINIILYVASAVLLFFSVMFIFGKIPAIFVFGALMLSKAPITYMLDISGFNMFFLAISLLIFLVTYFLDVFTKVKPVMCYIVSFVTLIVVIVINHFTYKPFEPVFAFDLSILNFRPSGYIFVSIAITFLALYGLLSFIKAKEDEISFANILLVVLLLILMFDYSSNNTYLFTIISFCIFAGIGLDNLVFRNYKAVPIADAAEQETVLEPAFEPVNEVLETSEAAEEIHEEVSDEPVKDNAAIEAETETPQKTEETPKKREVPSFFETPLPMPKKHVKKSFDYAFEPSGDMLKYDIEISPDDDFDIK